MRERGSGWSFDPGRVGRCCHAYPLEGRRLVIDATYMPGATEQDRAELAKIVNSIAFQALTTP